MRDPHIETLHYSVFGEGATEYVNPEPLGLDHPLGRLDIADGRLTLKPIEHFGSEADARAAFEPVLRAWEAAVDLEQEAGAIRFKFDRATVIDRAPHPQSLGVALHGVLGVATAGLLIASIKMKRDRYPQPRAGFNLTTEADIALRRWNQYRRGGEPLPSMAYSVLSNIERQFGGRPAAAKALAVEIDVLRKLAEFSSTRGDTLTARKAGTGVPLTGQETQWIEAAVRRLILRLGEHASVVVLAQIKLSDLPQLP